MEKLKVLIEDNSIKTITENHEVIDFIVLEDIIFIGEYTNDQGPFLDDWFLFIVDNNEEIFTISMNSGNMEKVIEYLSSYFKFERDLRLANSTNWLSFALYPEKLYGSKFLSLQKAQPKNLFRKILHFFKVYQFEIEYSSEFKSLIKG